MTHAQINEKVIEKFKTRYIIERSNQLKIHIILKIIIDS